MCVTVCIDVQLYIHTHTKFFFLVGGPFCVLVFAGGIVHIQHLTAGMLEPKWRPQCLHMYICIYTYMYVHTNIRMYI